MSTVFRVEKNANYTVMANYHLKDRRLSYKAKGLLSEMLSLPPDWDYTLSGLAVIAADGLDSVRSAIRELEMYGYLVRSQSRDERGRMSVNEFIVYENPADNPDHTSDGNNGNPAVENSVKNVSDGSAKGNSPSSENPVTVGKSDKKRNFLRKPPLEKSSPTKPLSENPTTATYNKLNKQELNTHKSNHSINRRADARSEDRIDRIFSQEPDFSGKEREYYREIIKSNIEYDYFVEKYDGMPFEKFLGMLYRQKWVEPQRRVYEELPVFWSCREEIIENEIAHQLAEIKRNKKLAKLAKRKDGANR